MTSILLITDAATGGKVRPPGGKVQYGNWNPNAIFVSRPVPHVALRGTEDTANLGNLGHRVWYGRIDSTSHPCGYLWWRCLAAATNGQVPAEQ
jgi:poly(3-hydroxybutyrate) depolymerase